MVRWLALALLLLNAVAYLWWSQQPGMTPGVAALLPPEGELLRLLEPDAEPRRIAAELPRRGQLELIELTPPPRTVCGLIGPFDSDASARQARSELPLSSGVMAEVVSRPVVVRTDYWVHLGPFASRDSALVRLRELHAAGIDSFIITDGELTNAISLGYFTREQLAQRSLQESRQRGLDAHVRAIPRQEHRAWVRVMPAGGFALPEQLIGNVVKTNRWQIEKNFCDMIATLEKFE
jgi:hypothetical protein